MHAGLKLLDALPDSSAGRQARWYFALLISAGEGAKAADRDRYTPEMAKRLNFGTNDEEERNGWRGFSARMGTIAQLSVTATGDSKIELLINTAKDRRWYFILEVEECEPYRISRVEWQRQFDFDIEVRDATDADGAILADIERRCPIVLGDTSVYFDRGADYLAFTRLMDEWVIGIASVDGVPAAVSCGALHQVRIGGIERPLVTVAHLRVLPEHQRKGLWGAANRALQKLFDRADGSNAYISVSNSGMQHGFINTPNKWPIAVLRAQLDCTALGGPAAGRPATIQDAPAIVEMLNAFHRDEELYVPYSVESFTRRVVRAPELYSWEKIWMSDAAVVGVWPAENALKVISETAGTRSESRRSVVLDYAFLPGADDEFTSLLRAWCGWLSGIGIDTLSIYTSPSSRGSAEVSAIAREVEPFNMWTPGISVPSDAKERGLYTDPVYF